VWYADIDEPTRLAQLVQRHVTLGKRPPLRTPGRTEGDQRNAYVVEATRDRADLVIRLTRFEAGGDATDENQLPDATPTMPKRPS
jgi:hypothetical protein